MNKKNWIKDEIKGSFLFDSVELDIDEIMKPFLITLTLLVCLSAFTVHCYRYDDDDDEEEENEDDEENFTFKIGLWTSKLVQYSRTFH